MIALLVMAGLAIFRMVRTPQPGGQCVWRWGAPFAFQGNGPRPGCSGRCVQSSPVKPENVGNDASARPWERI